MHLYSTLSNHTIFKALLLQMLSSVLHIYSCITGLIIMISIFSLVIFLFLRYLCCNNPDHEIKGLDALPLVDMVAYTKTFSNYIQPSHGIIQNCVFLCNFLVSFLTDGVHLNGLNLNTFMAEYMLVVSTGVKETVQTIETLKPSLQ